MGQKISRNQDIKDASANERASYYKNMSGIREIARLDKGIDVRSDMLSIAKVIEFSHEFTYSGGVLRVTLDHNLGYRPVVLGSVELKTRGNTRIIGDMPDVYEATIMGHVATIYGGGKLWVDDVTPSQVTLAWKITGVGDETLKIKLYLLTNASI